MMEKTSLTGWKQELTLEEEDTAPIVLPLPLGRDSLALSDSKRSMSGKTAFVGRAQVQGELSNGNLWRSFFPASQWKEDVNIPFAQFPKDNLTYSQNKANLHFPFLHLVFNPSNRRRKSEELCACAELIRCM